MKNVIITGCNRGIGAGIRDSLLSAGYRVFGLNRTPSKTKHRHYRDVPCDVNKKEDIENAVRVVKKQAKTIDVFIPNAAIRKFAPVSKLADNDWKVSIDTNLNSVFYLTKHLVSDLIKNKGYCIFIGSHAEKYPFGNGSAYCATKSAMRALSECLLEEVRHKGVRCTYLSIGAVKNRNHGYDEAWKLTPADVGELIVNLLKTNARALASYIDLRPAQPLTESKQGIEKLQYK